MAVHAEGKTINELNRIEDITGQEIIPLSMFNQETGAYVTRGITIDNLFKIIYGKIQEAESQIEQNAAAMTSYVSYLTSTDEALISQDDHLNSEIVKTNTYISYNAEGIIKVHNELRDLTTYTYVEVGYLESKIDDGTEHEAYQDAEIAHNRELIAYEAMRNNVQDEQISYEAYRNNVQDRDIKTIYIENSKDAFNDYGNPNDDNVNPDLDPNAIFNSW